MWVTEWKYQVSSLYYTSQTASLLHSHEWNHTSLIMPSFLHQKGLIIVIIVTPSFEILPPHVFLTFVENQDESRIIPTYMHKWNCVLSKFWSCSPQEKYCQSHQGLDWSTKICHQWGSWLSLKRHQAYGPIPFAEMTEHQPHLFDPHPVPEACLTNSSWNTSL